MNSHSLRVIAAAGMSVAVRTVVFGFGVLTTPERFALAHDYSVNPDKFRCSQCGGLLVYDEDLMNGDGITPSLYIVCTAGARHADDIRKIIMPLVINAYHSPPLKFHDTRTSLKILLPLSGDVFIGIVVATLDESRRGRTDKSMNLVSAMSGITEERFLLAKEEYEKEITEIRDPLVQKFLAGPEAVVFSVYADGVNPWRA